MLSSEYEKEPITNYFYNFFKEGSAHAIYVVVAVVVYTKHFSNWTPFENLNNCDIHINYHYIFELTKR